MKLKETLIFVYQCKFWCKERGLFYGNKLLRYVPDKKSSVVIDGDITGKSLILSAFGGHTTVKGTLDVKRLYVADSVVNFKGAQKA